MKYRVKIGTHSVRMLELPEPPRVGLRFLAEYPTGGFFTARITEVQSELSFAEWC